MKKGQFIRTMTCCMNHRMDISDYGDSVVYLEDADAVIAAIAENDLDLAKKLILVGQAWAEVKRHIKARMEKE